MLKSHLMTPFIVLTSIPMAHLKFVLQFMPLFVVLSMSFALQHLVHLSKRLSQVAVTLVQMVTLSIISKESVQTIEVMENGMMKKNGFVKLVKEKENVGVKKRIVGHGGKKMQLMEMMMVVLM